MFNVVTTENVTGCRIILPARGGNRTWAAGSKGHVAVKAGFYRKAVEVCNIPIPTTYFPALN